MKGGHNRTHEVKPDAVDELALFTTCGKAGNFVCEFVDEGEARVTNLPLRGDDERHNFHTEALEACMFV